MGRSICSANNYCDNKGEGIYAVLTVIMTITGRLFAVLGVIVTIMTIMGRFICSANSYYDNNGEVICSVNSYCDNNDYNGEVYM